MNEFYKKKVKSQLRDSEKFGVWEFVLLQTV